MPALRDIAWEWDPIGLGNDRMFTEDEYDCIVHGVLSQLARGADSDEVLAFLNAELPEHFGLDPQPEAAAIFAARIAAWWSAQPGTSQNPVETEAP